MSLASWVPAASNFSFPSYSSFCYGTQLDTGNLRRIGDASSRLFENSSGEVFLHEKPLAEVVGGRVVRPLVNGAVNAFFRIHSLARAFFPFLPAIPAACVEELYFTDPYELKIHPDDAYYAEIEKRHFTDPQDLRLGLAYAYAVKLPSSHDILHFPSSKELHSCLENHPLMDPHIYNQGIVCALADKLGEQSMFPFEIVKIVPKILSDLIVDYPKNWTRMILDIMESVKDCAQYMTTDPGCHYFNASHVDPEDDISHPSPA